MPNTSMSSARKLRRPSRCERLRHDLLRRRRKNRVPPAKKGEASNAQNVGLERFIPVPDSPRTERIDCPDGIWPTSLRKS